MKAASASKKKGVLKKTRNSRTIWNYHIMVLIGMVWLFFFNIVPMFGIVIAFEDYNPMSGLWHSDFVGMENFAYLFSMSDCKRVIINTLVIAVAKLILNIIVPLAFALLLNEIRQVKFKKAGKRSSGNVRLQRRDQFDSRCIRNPGKDLVLRGELLPSVSHRFGCLERVRIQCRYLSGSPYRYQPGALRSGSD